jgi:hypothetical protein
MRLYDISYITPKKDHYLKTRFIFENQKILDDIKKIPKRTNPVNLSLKVDKLIAKHSLDKKFKKEIEYFIQNDGYRDSNFLFDRDGLVFQLPKTKESHKYAYLRVGPRTKKKDFLDAYEIVKPFLDNQKERNRKTVYEDRNKLIFEMAQKGSCWEDIQDKVRWVFEQKVKEALIRNTYARMCEKLNIPKNDRLVIYSRKNYR